MACPYCTELYFILTVFVAPRCGGTLSFEVGTKHENLLWMCRQQTKKLKKKKKKKKKSFPKKKFFLNLNPKMFDAIAKCRSTTNLVFSESWSDIKSLLTSGCSYFHMHN